MNLNGNDAPLISVIVSSQTTERGELAHDAEDLSTQTFRDFEVIPVDKTARSIGIARARGKYVYFFDTNSHLLDSAFDMLYRTAEENNADVVHSTMFLEQSEEKSTSSRQVSVRAEEPQRKGLLGTDRTQLLIDHLVDRKFNASIGLNLCRREFLLSNSAVLADKIAEDDKFFAALLNLADRFYCLPKFFCLQIKQPSPVDKPAEPSKPIYIADLERDEIRDGFFVTSHRKKLWNVQLQLVMEVDRICRKHGLKWFAHYGTMLGAVRHHGFIPWDDDVDLVMLRADYDKFIEVAPRELKSNYFLDLWYNHRLEEEGTGDENLPLVSKRATDAIRKHGWYWPLRWNFFKLRDSDTTMIQWKDRKNVNQGIWLDVFPFDPSPPFDDEQSMLNFKMGKELLLATSDRAKVLKMLDEKHEFVTPVERLKAVLELPFKQRALALEDHLSKTNFDSPNVSFLGTYKEGLHYRRQGFDETLQMPFEMTELACPAGYDEMLNARYGDWHKIVFAPGHVVAHSDNLSYVDYFKLSKY